MRINCCVFTVQRPVREEECQGKKGRDTDKQKICAFVLGAIFQHPRRAGAQVGEVFCLVQLCVCVCESRQWLMQLSL